MRIALRLLGSVLIAGSLLGLGALGLVLVVAEPGESLWFGEWISAWPRIGAGERGPGAHAGLQNPTLAGRGPRGWAGSSPTKSDIDSRPARIGTGDQAAVPYKPITHLDVSSINLSVEVVSAALVERDGGLTWEVPAFKVGHAEDTAGAGQPGTGVLLGHVTSLRSGNVFQDLDRVQVGDSIGVSADDEQFLYRVISKTSVPRSDTSVLEPRGGPAVLLITCTGMWLPTIWDYTERLVVHAELADIR